MEIWHLVGSFSGVNPSGNWHHWSIGSLIHWFIGSLVNWFTDALVGRFPDSLIHGFDSLFGWLIDSLIYWFIVSLIPWVLGLLIFRLVASLIHWLIDSLLHSFIESLIHWFTASLIRWFLDSLIDWLIVWFIDSLLRSFIDSLIHRFPGPLVHRFVGSLIQSVSQSVVHGFFHVLRWHLNTHSLIRWHNFNASWLLHLQSSPIGHPLPIVMSLFRTFRLGAGRALPVWHFTELCILPKFEVLYQPTVSHVYCVGLIFFGRSQDESFVVAKDEKSSSDASRGWSLNCRTRQCLVGLRNSCETVVKSLGKSKKHRKNAKTCRWPVKTCFSQVA